MKHPIKKGECGGRYQHSKAGDRYLLADKKVRTGDGGGKYQMYGGGKKRYLLK